MIDTPRLTLIPATVPLVRAEMENHETLARLLGARVPENWPPEQLADAAAFFFELLSSHPEMVGWLSWYWVTRGDDRVLIGCGGYKGPPRPDGGVEVGYSVLPQYQGRGFATEAVAGLIEWAFAHRDVSHIVAEASRENQASIHVLGKLGFHAVGPGSESGTIHFLLERR